MSKRKQYNHKLRLWLEKNAKDYTAIELIPRIEILFKEKFTLKQMQQYLWHHNINYKKEMPNRSHSNIGVPIGTERTKSDGMVQIKVSPKKWVYKQRKIYEDYYNVKLKEDEYVIFLDQNRNNFDINNLKLISRKESAIMANEDLFSKEKQATECGISIAKLMIKTKEKTSG